MNLTAKLLPSAWLWAGFLLYLPFLIIDMVVASVLLSMGMMMLPACGMPFSARLWWPC